MDFFFRFSEQNFKMLLPVLSGLAVIVFSQANFHSWVRIQIVALSLVGRSKSLWCEALGISVWLDCELFVQFCPESFIDSEKVAPAPIFFCATIIGV